MQQFIQHQKPKNKIKASRLLNKKIKEAETQNTKTKSAPKCTSIQTKHTHKIQNQWSHFPMTSHLLTDHPNEGHDPSHK